MPSFTQNNPFIVGKKERRSTNTKNTNCIYTASKYSYIHTFALKRPALQADCDCYNIGDTIYIKPN